MEHAQHDAHPHVNYWAIFMALCGCTAISVVFDFIPIAPVVVAGVLAVAAAKALFVMTFFMHLKFEGAWKFVILLPTAILAVGLMVALAPDMAMHYYRSEAPQIKAGLAAGHGHEDPSDEGAAHEHEGASSGHH